MSRSLVLLIALAISLPTDATAQLFRNGDPGPRPLLSPGREIALARSAAPASVSDSASIYVLARNGYDLVIQGTNGVACYVSRAWVASIEPHCFDREGAATIMKIGMRRVELLHGGMSVEDANRTLAAAILEGTLRLPDRPVMSWMMSSAQQLVGDGGRAVGAWRPHVMIYYPYLTAEDAGLAGAPGAPLSAVMANPGSALANVVVVVPEFVDPEPAGSASR